MPDTTEFNLNAGVKSERKLLITCVNVGTKAAPEWEMLGYGIEDSAIEYNFDEQIVTDILGITSATISKPQRRQTFDPHTMRGGSEFQVKLYNIMRHERWGELANMDMLLVHLYVGDTSGYDAERFVGSAINPQSIGGSGTLDAPFDAVFGGEHVLGTATVSGSTVTFTEE